MLPLSIEPDSCTSFEYADNEDPNNLQTFLGNLNNSAIIFVAIFVPRKAKMLLCDLVWPNMYFFLA